MMALCYLGKISVKNTTKGKWTENKFCLILPENGYRTPLDFALQC